MLLRARRPVGCCIVGFFTVVFLYVISHGIQSVMPWHGFIYQILVTRGMPSIQRIMREVSTQELDPEKCHGAYIRDPTSTRLQIAGYNYSPVPNCHLPLCALNNHHLPVNVLTCDVTPAEMRVTEKVTVIVKTTQRLKETMRLINSLHKIYPGLKVEVVDDEANITRVTDSKDEQHLWETFVSQSNGSVHYTKLPGDAAISKGRNAALRLVNTEYFLLVDDDFVADNKTNISKMVDILDRTDLTIVAGELIQHKRRRVFSGIVRVHQRPEQSNESQFFEYFDLAYEEIPFFPSCYAVDYVLNAFLGRTEEIMKLGGWDENLPVGEHRDFLLRLREAKYKVAFCTDVVFTHLPPGLVLNVHTMNFFEKSGKHYYAKKWGVPFDKFISCRREQYFSYSCK